MSYLIKRFNTLTNPDLIQDSTGWNTYWADTKHIKPLDLATIYPAITDLSFNLRDNGGESITFSCYETALTTDLEIGKIYTFYLDGSFTRLLPCTCILSKKTMRYQGNMKWFECEGISVNDYLYRKWLNFNYKNITIRNLLINLLEQTRFYVPYINPDTSLIQDINYTFLVFQDSRKYLGEVVEQIRQLGFICYLDAELRLVLKENIVGNSIFTADFQKNTIDNDLCILEDSKVGVAYPSSPITTLILQGGSYNEGFEKEISIFGTGDPLTGALYDLDSKVNDEENFVLETFDSITPDNMTVENLSGTSWTSRYGVYDDAIETQYPFEAQIKLEVINATGRSYVLGLQDGTRYYPTDLYAGIVLEDEYLKIIVNGIYYDIAPIKYSIERSVISKTNDNKTFELDDITGLSVGDRVTIAGLSSTLILVDEPITSIDTLNNTVTFATSAIDGAITNVKLRRVTSYIFKINLVNSNNIQVWCKEANGQFELKGTYSVSLPDNVFITVFNNQNGNTAIVDNGIYEVGNLAIDYFFIDKAKFIRMIDEDGNKVSICKSDQFPTVEVDAVVNTIQKNGTDYSQIEFISPSVTPVVLDSTGTVSRIPLALSSDTFIKEGMRILFNQREYFITDYLVSTQGYIDITPDLPSVPIVKTPVYINTSIPEINQQFTITYLEAKTLYLKECSDAATGNGACTEYGYREGFIEIPEITNIKVLQERAIEILNDECALNTTGNLGFIMNDLDSCIGGVEKEWFNLPFVGEYITVNDSNQSLTNELCMVQAISYKESKEFVNDIPRINIAIDFGQPKTDSTQALINLLKRFGVFKGTVSDQINIEMPCALRDEIDIFEDLQVVASTGYPFYSGGYQINYSGYKEYIEPTDSLQLITSTGYPFYSGGYILNTSGALTS